MTTASEVYDELTAPDEELPDYATEADDGVPEAEADALIQAGIHLRYVQRWRRERAMVEDVFQAEVDAITKRRDRRLAQLDSRVAWHEVPLRAIHEALRTRNPKRWTTVHLAMGVLKSRAGTLDYVVDDEKALLAWAQTNDQRLVALPSYSPPPPRLDRKALRELVKPTHDDMDESPGELTGGKVVPHLLIVRKATTYWDEEPADEEPVAEGGNSVDTEPEA